MADQPVRVELALSEEEVDLRGWARRLVESVLRLERPGRPSEEDAA